MKASIQYRKQLKIGIEAFIAKFGGQVLECNPHRLNHLIRMASNPAGNHPQNVQVQIPINLDFEAEVKTLKDAHIETAVNSVLDSIRLSI